jgi:hypothetical protein
MGKSHQEIAMQLGLVESSQSDAGPDGGKIVGIDQCVDVW